jgi:hypothetical protein
VPIKAISSDTKASCRPKAGKAFLFDLVGASLTTGASEGVKFIEGDLFEANLREATACYTYFAKST